MRLGSTRRSLLLCGALLVACQDDEAPTVESQPSPNASILPAPLASARDLVAAPRPTASATVRRPRVDAGPAATASKPLVPQRAAVNEPLPRDDLTSKDSVGLTLAARFDWAEAPTPPKVPELSRDAIRRAREATALSVEIDLAYAGRMRFSLESPAFPLPEGTELRGRVDYFGYALVWPQRNRYRVLAPGSLRAIFAERRPDVTPLMRASLTPGKEGQRLGLATSVVHLETNVGTVDLEQAEVNGSGRSGALLCRFLAELISLEPSTAACAEDRVPLAARFEWADGGSLKFEVTALQNREDLPLDRIAVPPAGAQFVTGQLPPQPTGVFLSREQLAAFRVRPRLSQTPPEEGAPSEGLSAHNQTNTLKYILVDGVPVAWVRPRHERDMPGFKPGQYAIDWRDFLGRETGSAGLAHLPARVTLGSSEDAGSQTP